MSRNNFYINGGTRAYLIKDGEPIHLELLAVEAVRLSKKQALLRQFLLQGVPNLLVNFPEGARIDITYQDWGKFEYSENQTIIRLTNCKIRRNWIPNPVTSSPEQDALSVYALICCDIEVLNENNH